jgi:lysophospholipase L1-like esterase
MQTLSATKVASISTQSDLKIIALGDSLVYGFGDPVGGGWVERLRRQWMTLDRGRVLYNLGIRGDRVAQVAHRLEREFCNRGELRDRLPNSIILSVGVNDSARLGRLDGRNYTNFEKFQQQIVELLERSQQLCPIRNSFPAPLLFVGIVPVDESKMPFLDCLYYNHQDQYRYKEFTKQACEQRQIPYLDIFDRWMQRGDDWMRSRLSRDGLHPNTLGYESLLQDVVNWEPILQLSH